MDVLINTLFFVLAMSLHASATFNLKIIPFRLEPYDGNEADITKESSGEVVRIDEKTDYLNGGVVKTSKVQETRKLDAKNGTVTTERKVTEFYRYPNGTIRRIRYNDEEISEDTRMDCIEDKDCNNTQYCDRLTFACKSKLDKGGKCENKKQCKEGLRCRKNTCVTALGIGGEECTSDADCEESHCCAFRFAGNVCLRKPSLYEKCGEEDLFFSPKLFGLHRDLSTSERPPVCPCQTGLTCENRRTFFIFESKTCQNGSQERKEKRLKLVSKTKNDFKRSIVDDMLDVVASLLKSVKPKKMSPSYDERK